MDMACHLHKTVIILLLIVMGGTLVNAGQLDLNVVYPKTDQFLPAVDSTFIFGSVEKNAHVYVNGLPVEVHEDGGWLAFVPVAPGDFTFKVTAEKKGITDAAIVPVHLPKLPEYNYGVLSIDSGSLRPSGQLSVMPGDIIDISCRALPYCNMYCTIEPTGDTVWMAESAPRNYYGSRNVFEFDGDSAEGHSPDSLLIRGLYSGTYIVPKTSTDSLRFVYHIYPPSNLQLARLRQNAEPDQPILVEQLSQLPDSLSVTSPTAVEIIPARKIRTVEFADSLTIIRTEAGKGYLCIHQPAGIRARYIGRDGRWLKIKLSDYQVGWVIDTAVAILPGVAEIPHSYISRIQTINHPNRVNINFSTSGRHPFRVVENIEEQSITIYLYGADADTDWIRYDNTDDLIDHAVWFQDEPGVFGFKIYLRGDQIWGYDGYYVGNQFNFDIRRPPGSSKRISQFRFIIDAGHSPDVGAVGPTGLTEKEANLAIAHELRKTLEREGAEVVMTRTGYDDVSLYERPQIALRKHGDIFISIHNNALPDGTNPFVNNGVSTYYYHPHSAHLAHAVQESLARSIGLADFGWYYGNLAVNRPTQYPAILVECAFMMIPEQEAALKSGSFQKKLARAITEGVNDFLRGHAKTNWEHQQDISYGRE